MSEKLRYLIRRSEAGQTLVEYSMLLAFMALTLIGTMVVFSGGLSGLYGVIQAVVDALGTEA